MIKIQCTSCGSSSFITKGNKKICKYCLTEYLKEGEEDVPEYKNLYISKEDLTRIKDTQALYKLTWSKYVPIGISLSTHYTGFISQLSEAFIKMEEACGQVPNILVCGHNIYNILSTMCFCYRDDEGYLITKNGLRVVLISRGPFVDWEWYMICADYKQFSEKEMYREGSITKYRLNLNQIDLSMVSGHVIEVSNRQEVTFKYPILNTTTDKVENVVESTKKSKKSFMSKIKSLVRS